MFSQTIHVEKLDNCLDDEGNFQATNFDSMISDFLESIHNDNKVLMALSFFCAGENVYCNILYNNKQSVSAPGDLKLAL